MNGRILGVVVKVNDVVEVAGVDGDGIGDCGNGDEGSDEDGVWEGEGGMSVIKYRLRGTSIWDVREEKCARRRCDTSSSCAPPFRTASSIRFNSVLSLLMYR